MSAFLQDITTKTRERIAAVKSDRYAAAFRRKADRRSERNSLAQALRSTDGVNIIAEIKRASPSKGTIKANIDAAGQARRYSAGGAAAISVLTESEHFGGSIDDLLKVRSAVNLPVLRKDFIVDEFQILEAAAAGADAVLLIVAALSNDELFSFRKTADEVSLETLVEVHDQSEFQRAIDAGATLIGVNNRNLSTLDVSLRTSRDLAALKPGGALFVAESGISSRAEIDELKGLGFDGFLIGETLMRSDDPVALLGSLGA